MRRKPIFSPEEKLQAINNYLTGVKGKKQTCCELGVSKTSFNEWLRNFRLYGIDGLQTINKTSYPTELKYQAVTDYLNGLGSSYEVCEKYKISSRSILYKWIKQYKSDSKFEPQQKNKERKTSYEDRIAIVLFCVSNNDNYKLTADKFKVSYYQVYRWVKKYHAEGGGSLIDFRGKYERKVSD